MKTLTNYKLVWYNIAVGGEKIEKRREYQIIREAYKAHLREELSLTDIQDIKRKIGNSIGKPELKRINVTAAEALKVSNILIGEIVEDVMSVFGPQA